MLPSLVVASPGLWRNANRVHPEDDLSTVFETIFIPALANEIPYVLVSDPPARIFTDDKPSCVER